ncbi:MAG: hypothetical protein ABIF19_06060 [Planctomycetota bacterium]
MKKLERHEALKARKIAALVTCAFALAMMAGCDSLRFAPSQAQKQNAWLHNRTSIVAAETARAEDASQQLQALTQLSEVQSRAFSTYCGLPDEFPDAESAEDILAESNFRLANAALQDGVERPDPWQVADAAMELGIGICALLGGVYGTRAVGFLRDARGKSQALQEIIVGNELFKKQNTSAAPAFKQAHQTQSPQTRQLVAQMKA